MTISTKAQLITAIQTWAVRPDFSSAQCDDFIVLTEAIFNFGDGKPGADDYIAPLRTRDMYGSDTVTITNGVGTLPTDCAELTNVYVSTDKPLTYVTPEWYFTNFPEGQDADPNFYTITGPYIRCSADVALEFYNIIPGLATTDPNWLLTKAPNAYLHGGLYFLNVFDKNGDAAAVHRSLMASAIAGLQGADMSSVIVTPQRRSSMVAW